jgi:hypothetical protein
MQTECSADLFGFAPVERRAVVAGFDGGRMTSDAGALLLGATDRAIGLVERFAACFTDGRAPELTEHEVSTMVGQRIFGIALGYEDLVDHDQLRHDPTMAVLAGKLAARRKDCAPLAGKSTLNRLELGGPELSRYHRIAWDGAKIEALFVDLFLEAHRQPPKQIILDLDATDDPLHGHQEGRFFHGYYDCYCYLPLYIFCGTHLLAAKQRCANIDAAAGAVEETARIVAQIRARWPEVRIVLRADSGFAREALMGWCEANGVDFLFGLAKNQRLVAEIGRGRRSHGPRQRPPRHRRNRRAAPAPLSTSRARKFREPRWRPISAPAHRPRLKPARRHLRPDRIASSVISSRAATISRAADPSVARISHKPKSRPTTNLKYLIAAALLDGQVGPQQLELSCIQAADAQELLARVGRSCRRRILHPVSAATECQPVERTLLPPRRRIGP